MTDHPNLTSLPTPCLLLDEARMMRNIARLRARLDGLGVMLRPHLKTAKSIDVARRLLTGGDGPATVSTLREAEVFAEAGVKDILYGVGISPDKLPRVLALRAKGCDLSIIVDSIEQAIAVADSARRAGDAIPTLLEIDCDGRRSGLAPGDPALIDIARILIDGGARLKGVLTHAGGSYAVSGKVALAAFAERERSAAVSAAEQLRSAGLPCGTVSIGSTPTAHFAQDLSGVTEVRAGVFVFFDLVMAGIGVCTTDDIALSVLATVIGHQKARGWTMIDAGWMAMSRDLGLQASNNGYGLICDADGRVFEDLVLSEVNQEHGVVALRPGSRSTAPDLPVGTKLRILPNHACSTGAQFDAFAVLPADADAEIMRWPRFRGW